MRSLGYCKVKLRKYTTLSGGGPGEHNFMVHNNSLKNVLRALVERGWLVKEGDKLAPPPAANRQELKKIRMFTDSIIEGLGAVRKYSVSEFVETCAPHRRKLYQQMADKLENHTSVDKWHSFIKLFIKAEKVNVSKKPDPAPRMIQPRDPLFNLVVGCYLRPIEHPIYNQIDRIWSEKVNRPGLRTVMKGMNAEVMGEAIRASYDHIQSLSHGPAVIVSMDAARWDQHVSVEALKEEHRVYNTVYHSDELAALLRQQLVTEGSAMCTQGQEKFRVSYRRTGGRCSGDMNTGLGNVMLACGLMYTALENYTCHLINNGDDCVVIFTSESFKRFKRNKDKFIQEWKSFGFTMEFEGEPTTVFEEMEFCQMGPVCVAGVWRMVRRMSSLDKDAVIVGRDSTSIDTWLHNVGTGGSIACSGVPIHSTYYDTLPRTDKPGRSNSSNVTHAKMKYLSAGLECQPNAPVEDSTRESYARFSGISPVDQVMCEEYIRMNRTRGPALPMPMPEHRGIRDEIFFSPYHKSRKWMGKWGHDS